MKKYSVTFIGLFVMVLGAFAQSPYISKVWDYSPAPGQYTNMLPKYNKGDNAEDMRQKADQCLVDNAQVLISLGGWGGSVTFGFDHMIQNVPGDYDFKVLGNAFYADANPKDTTAKGGSAEPGIVMVSYDANDNGLPDDEWYELAGSEHGNPLTYHNYSQTYFRPAPDHVATPSKVNRALTDTTYIRWTNSLGQEDYMFKNMYHAQDYYPAWIEEDQLTFTGTRLRDNGRDESGRGTYYVLYMFDWGYVDNQPNETKSVEHASEFKIDWAVDEDGEPVQLPGIHFVRVYTGVNQYNGHLGECSTEVMGAWDLHLIETDLNSPIDNNLIDWQHAMIYDMLGNCHGIDNTIVAPGVYILRANNGQTKKVYIQ